MSVTQFQRHLHVLKELPANPKECLTYGFSNRTIKEATVQRFYYATHDQLRTHLADFVAAYTVARRLKTLKGLTPYEFICKRSILEPERFRLDPRHQSPGLNM